MKARLALAFVAAVFFICFVIFFHPESVLAGPSPTGSSQLQIIDKDGKPAGLVPLRHTRVTTEISGFVARIEVTQEFENVLPDSVEAIYVFPLPHDSAVDGMTMRVGDREIQAVIREREEARKIYEAARNAGYTAALLHQERPNIFTQSVTNIAPGSKVEVKLSVLELLKYEAGTYEFDFPTVVGPRYIPGSPIRQLDRGQLPDTDQVPDASKISPPIAGVDTGEKHAGHDFSIDVTLKAGVPIGDVESASHKIFADRTGPDSFHIRLADEAVLPNKDFVLKYKVAGPQISDAVLTHADGTGGYFTLILQPPERVSDEAAVPRQLIFVLDTSGSMFGFPIETAKKTMLRAIEHLRSDETFNLITFSGATRVLFPQPVPATPENIAQAKQVLAGAYGSGGTEMMAAIRAALGDDAAAGKPQESDPVRVVCFMTDGYVGNDAEIVAEVKKHPDARVFGFGIGTAVNRFLLSKMSEEGHGEVEYVTNSGEAEAAADRFYERVHTPVLTNISIDWNGLPVTDVYPREVRDLFAAKPIIITGRFARPASGNIVVKGTQGTGEFQRSIPVNFTATAKTNAALEKIWARNKVEDLMSQDWLGIEQGNSKYKADIIKVGLEHSLATQYTSFVAVETRTVVKDGKPVRIEVPVELPEGVSPLAVQTETRGFAAGYLSSKDALVHVPSAGLTVSEQAGMVSKSDRFAGNETIDIVQHAVRSAPVSGPVSRASGGASSAGKLSSLPPPSPTLSKRDERKQLESKLKPDLLHIYDCASSHRLDSASGACNAIPQRVRVSIDLSSITSAVQQKLAKVGFRAQTGAATTHLVGSIPAKQLRSLARIDEVLSVSLVK